MFTKIYDILEDLNNINKQQTETSRLLAEGYTELRVMLTELEEEVARRDEVARRNATEWYW